MQQSSLEELKVDDEPNVFGFFDDEDKIISDNSNKRMPGKELTVTAPSKESEKGKANLGNAEKKPSIDDMDVDKLPHIDLTENPHYLLHFSYSNGFVWNEEVLLSPPFYASSFGSSPGSQSSSHQNRVFPSLMAERLRRQRIAQETKVAEIRFDD